MKLHVNRRARTPAAAPIAAAPTRVAEHLGDRPGVAVGIATVDEVAGDAVVDDVEQAADGAGDDRDAARRRLERDEPEALAATGHDTRSAARYQLDRMWCGCGATNRTRSGDAEVDGEAAGERRLADRRRRRWRRRRSPARRRAGASAARARIATSGALSGWIRPTNSITGRSTGSPTARRAPAAVAGREEGVLDGRRDDLDAPGRVAVEATELALLLGAADADRVAAADDVGLGPVAPLRLEVAALGLDPGQRVERRHERDVEGVLEAVADHAAQPVVAVDDVDAGAGARRGRARRR